MKWLINNKLGVVLLYHLSLTCLAGEYVSYNNCSSSYYEKRTMQWSNAWPESLSHLPSRFTEERNLYLLEVFLRKFKDDIDDFPDIYKATLSIVKKNCSAYKQQIGADMRSKYVAAFKLYDELNYSYNLLRDSNLYRQNTDKLKLSIHAAIKLKQIVEKLSENY